jgi:hypothetical protein
MQPAFLILKRWQGAGSVPFAFGGGGPDVDLADVDAVRHGESEQHGLGDILRLYDGEVIPFLVGETGVDRTRCNGTNGK